MTQPTVTAAGSWQPLSPPFNLKNGTRYAATIVLSTVEKAFATQALIANKFLSAGFRDVACAPDKRRVEGCWNKPDQENVTLPSQVREVFVWKEEAGA